MISLVVMMRWVPEALREGFSADVLHKVLICPPHGEESRMALWWTAVDALRARAIGGVLWMPCELRLFLGIFYLIFKLGTQRSALSMKDGM